MALKPYVHRNLEFGEKAMALNNVSDYQVRLNELLLYIERRYGMRMGDFNQNGDAVVYPALDEIVRTVQYNTSSAETTAYADFKTILWSYITYRNTRLNLPGGPGV
jgi:hypothetical protein